MESATLLGAECAARVHASRRFLEHGELLVRTGSPPREAFDRGEVEHFVELEIESMFGWRSLVEDEPSASFSLGELQAAAAIAVELGGFGHKASSISVLSVASTINIATKNGRSRFMSFELESRFDRDHDILVDL